MFSRIGEKERIKVKRLIVYLTLKFLFSNSLLQKSSPSIDIFTIDILVCIILISSSAKSARENAVQEQNA